MLKHKLKKTTEKMYFGRKSGEKKKSNSKENLYAKVRKSHNQNASRNERTVLDGGYFTGPESFYESPDQQRNSHENGKSSHGGSKGSHENSKSSHGGSKISHDNNSDYRSLRENSAHQRIIWEECDHLRESREDCDHYKGDREDCHNHRHSRNDRDPHFHHEHRSKQDDDLDYSRMENSLGYSSGEFSSGSFVNTENNKSYEKSSNQTKVRGETVDHRRQQNSHQQNSHHQQKSNQQKFNQKSYQQHQQQQQKFRKQLFSNQLPQPAPVVVPMQVLWNRRASPQEDFLYTAQGIQELVKQQNMIVHDLKRSLEATVINAKIKENRRNFKKSSHPSAKQSFQEPSSAMGKIRRLLEIEEMLSFSQKINSKISKQTEVK